MKRIISGLTALLLLFCLTACAPPEPSGSQPAGSSPPVSASREETEPPEPPEPSASQAPGEISFTLLEGAEHLGEALWKIPADFLDSTGFPALTAMGDTLLYSSVVSAGSWGTDLLAVAMNTRSGEVSAMYRRPSNTFRSLQAIAGGAVVLEGFDSLSLTFLDEALTETRVAVLPGSFQNPYISTDGKTLYEVQERCLTATDISSGETRALLTNVRNLFVQDALGTHLALTYDDTVTCLRRAASLDLETGLLEPAPCEPVLSGFTRWKELWCYQDMEDMALVRLGRDGQPDSLRLEGGTLTLLDGNCLLGADQDGPGLGLYSPDGTCLGRGTLPASFYLIFGVKPLWSEAAGGCFLLAGDTRSDGFRLLFLQAGEGPGEEASLTRLSWEEAHPRPPEDAVEPALYARAEALSRKFGITLRIADQCTRDFPAQTYSPLTDPAQITRGLDCLERALSAYPAGFLEQLPYGRIHHVEIYLAHDLIAGPSYGDDRGYYGFAIDGGDTYYILLETPILEERNLFHEISHIIDQKLDYASTLREDALYSQEGWMGLQPPGFEYAWRYTALPWLDASTEGWFTDSYALSFPTEDRARILEYAMWEERWEDTFRGAPHLQAKLRYYSLCIRDCFDTAGWPEVTRWERPLAPE